MGPIILRRFFLESQHFQIETIELWYILLEKGAFCGILHM